MLARRAGISFATVNRLCQNATCQVSLETLDKLTIALGEALGRSIKPGELLGFALTISFVHSQPLRADASPVFRDLLDATVERPERPTC